MKMISHPMVRAGWMAMLVAFTLALFFGCAEQALAQCAMCKEALANSPEAAAATRQFNLGILVLLVPPVAMFAGIFGLIYRSGKTQRDR